ncbi:hypothetical protein E2562_003760 [Oryza meyeriana var. granulata]|uniref:RRM domain-containing protein n=1 Tax=Oryza meyeriana var. granulata TaxID=110450 RepID=A0A6G1BQA1_9ORYZ|nr:hypothetical protein E2562_003760 [Oryza meyeriana var. granulata]
MKYWKLEMGLIGEGDAPVRNGWCLLNPCQAIPTLVPTLKRSEIIKWQKFLHTEVWCSCKDCTSIGTRRYPRSYSDVNTVQAHEHAEKSNRSRLIGRINFGDIERNQLQEMLDMKLKLKQMELNVLKLRSKQAQINNVKQGVLSSGPHSNLEEDADSRTVLMTNVHFAATKEALLAHFMKCGAVLKINILTDAITGHPKGAAFVTFADKESVEKAVSLSGSSFFSRVLTVMRKAEAPPGFLASVQPIGRPLQSWNSPPIQKGVWSVFAHP